MPAGLKPGLRGRIDSQALPGTAWQAGIECRWRKGGGKVEERGMKSGEKVEER